MPKSKRAKVFNMTATKAKGGPAKEHLIEKVRDCVEQYKHLYIFTVENMRNNHLKQIRTDWVDSRIFMGKNKVMACALGKSPSEEIADNLHMVSECLVGEVGILFTNRSAEEVKQAFATKSLSDFPRGGTEATKEYIIPEGRLAQFPNQMDTHLRSLGLPTALTGGKLVMLKEHVVCKEGQVLTVEQARILKLFDVKMATFVIIPTHHWTEGEFVELEMPEMTITNEDDDDNNVEGEGEWTAEAVEMAR